MALVEGQPRRDAKNEGSVIDARVICPGERYAVYLMALLAESARMLEINNQVSTGIGHPLLSLPRESNTSG